MTPTKVCGGHQNSRQMYLSLLHKHSRQEVTLRSLPTYICLQMFLHSLNNIINPFMCLILEPGFSVLSLPLRLKLCQMFHFSGCILSFRSPFFFSFSQYDPGAEEEKRRI